MVEVFSGFPHTNTHPFNSATTVPVDAALFEKHLKNAFVDPTERITVCQRALSIVSTDPRYLEAKRWERRAMAIAERHPFRVLWGVFAGLMTQNAILFYWVFFAFDWNLVEPCTYFFGYTSATWLALMFYKYTGREFTYDATVEELAKRKFNKLAKKNGYVYTQVLAEFRHKEEVLKREIESLGGQIPKEY